MADGHQFSWLKRWQVQLSIYEAIEANISSLHWLKETSLDHTGSVKGILNIYMMIYSKDIFLNTKAKNLWVKIS